MKKHASLMVAAACAALLAAPAFAQNASGGGAMGSMPMQGEGSMGAKPMQDQGSRAAEHGKMVGTAKAKAAKRPMRMARAARMRAKHTCMDYAWQSQDMKDCEAGKIKPPNWR